MSFSITLAAEDVSLGNKKNDVHSISDYLAHMLDEYAEGTEQCAFLPSLMTLSECFQCSAVEVHQALQEIQEQGCDFFIMGFESPITLWYPARLGYSAAG